MVDFQGYYGCCYILLSDQIIIIDSEVQKRAYFTGHILAKLARGFRLHQPHLCRRLKTTPKECPSYDAKQSVGEVPIILLFCEMPRTLFITIAPRSTHTVVVASESVQFLWNETKPKPAKSTCLFCEGTVTYFCVML